MWLIIQRPRVKKIYGAVPLTLFFPNDLIFFHIVPPFVLNGSTIYIERFND